MNAEDSPEESGDSEELDRAPIARILVSNGSRVVSRGTGTLIGSRLVLTALHVVANRRSHPPEPYPGEIALEFPAGTTRGRILPGAWDATADWVLIECDEEFDITPMKLGALRESRRDWTSFGFSDANPVDGLQLSGRVELCRGTLEGGVAHQLFSEQAAAGGGGKVKGLSGAAVIVDGHLVGVMRFALMENERTEMGTLYACPVALVAAKWPALDVPPLPLAPREESIGTVLAARAGWELSAFSGALLLQVLFLLVASLLHVPHTIVEGAVKSRDLLFTLPHSSPLAIKTRDSLLGVKWLEAEGFDSVTVPTRDGRAAVAVTNGERLRVTSASPLSQTLQNLPLDEPPIALDLAQMLGEETTVWLRQPIRSIPGRFNAVLTGVTRPLVLQLRGDLTLSTSVGGETDRSFPQVDSIMGFSSANTPIRVRFELLARYGQAESAHLANSLAVTDLEFQAPPLHGDTSRREEPMMFGTLRLDGRGSPALELDDRDVLTFGPTDTLQLQEVEMPASDGMMTIHFRGRVRSAQVRAEGVEHNVMPSYLARAWNRYPALTAALGVLGLALNTLLLYNWRNRRALRSSHPPAA